MSNLLQELHEKKIENFKRLWASCDSHEKRTLRECCVTWAEYGENEREYFEVSGPDFCIDGIGGGELDHETDAKFIAAAPDIVRQQAERIEKLETALNKICYLAVDDPFQDIAESTAYSVAADIASKALDQERASF